MSRTLWTILLAAAAVIGAVGIGAYYLSPTLVPARDVKAARLVTPPTEPAPTAQFVVLTQAVERIDQRAVALGTTTQALEARLAKAEAEVTALREWRAWLDGTRRVAAKPKPAAPAEAKK